MLAVLLVLSNFFAKLQDLSYSLNKSLFYFVISGTTAHIGIKLYGQQGKSEARHLSKTDLPAFQRNSMDKFFIAADTNLGDLWKVLIWHDNTGLSPSWYLHRVEVIDLQTEVKYHFLADSWLSVEQDNGMLQKEISVAGGYLYL